MASLGHTQTYLPKDLPKKRIIICCDGTWQASNNGVLNVPSNIARISRAIAKWEKTTGGEFIHQIVFYDAGVGTSTETVKDFNFIRDTFAGLVNKWDGGTVAGLDENICEAYNFIVSIPFIPALRSLRVW